MTKKELDQRLKADFTENRFTVDGDFIVFDNKSNLAYELVSGLTLKDFLTANPLSITRLNKNLLILVDEVVKKFGHPVNVRASYHSPEYHLLSFGCQDSDLYTSGNAVSLGVPSDKLDDLKVAALEVFTTQSDDELLPIGEVGLYPWGVHLGYTKNQKSWDYSSDNSAKQKIKNFITNDKMKNILLIGAAAAAGWFFFLRKK